MIETFEDAVIVAAEAHRGQVYEIPGRPRPYLYHVLRVGLSVSPRAQIVGVLHDVLEDTDVVPELADPVLQEALELVTAPEALTYEEYIERIAEAPGVAGEIAREVKLADLRENLQHIEHYGGPTHLAERYAHARFLLHQAREVWMEG